MTQTTYDTLVDKLQPARVVGASELMYFIVGRILRADWVTFAEDNGSAFDVTIDGHVVCSNRYIGSAADFERNVRGYVEAAQLTPDESETFWRLYSAAVTDWKDK